MEKIFVILYTNQKLKKAKTWHDGTLKHSGAGTRAVLYDDKGSRLDTIHVKIDDVVIGEQLESDRYFILIEDIKKSNDVQTITSLPNVSNSASTYAAKPSTTSTLSRARCAGLKRKNMGFMPPRMVKQPCIRDDTETEQVYPLSNSNKEKPAVGSNQQCRSDSSFTFVHKATDFNPSDGKEMGSRLPSSSVGRNLMHMYNNKVSSQESSSQESIDTNLFIRRSSPWSVYGSKNNSPNISNLFKQTNNAQSPSSESQSIDSPTHKPNNSLFKEDFQQFEAGMMSPGLDRVHSEKPLFSTDKHSFECGFYKNSPLIEENHFETSADHNIKHNDNNIDYTEEVIMSPLNRNVKCSSNPVENVPDKRNALQILKLLGKSRSAIAGKDFKSTEAHEPNSLPGLTNRTKSIQNTSEVTHFQLNLSESPFSDSYNEANLNCPSKNENEEMFDKFENKMKQLDSFNKKILSNVNAANESQEEYQPFTLENSNCVNDSLVDNILDNKPDTSSFDKIIDKENVASNSLVGVACTNVAVGKENEGKENEIKGKKVEENNESCLQVMEDDDVGDNDLDDDLMGSFHINFSPLSHVTDSESEVDIDKIESISCKEDASQICSTDSLKKKSCLEEYHIITEGNVDTEATSDIPLCSIASDNVCLSSVSQTEENKIVTETPLLPNIIESQSDSQPENILQDSSVGNLKELKNEDEGSVQGIRSRCVNRNDIDSVPDTYDNSEEKHENFCNSENSLKPRLDINNSCEDMVIDVWERDENENNGTRGNNDLEKLNDNQSGIDNNTGNKVTDKGENVNSDYNKCNTENERGCDNSESTQVSSQDTLEFSIGSLPTESQYFIGLHATRNDQYLTDCEMYKNKEVDSESEFAFSSWKPVRSENQNATDNFKPCESEQILSHTSACNDSPQYHKSKTPYDNVQPAFINHSNVLLGHNDDRDQLNHHMGRLYEGYEKSIHQDYGYQVPAKFTVYGKNVGAPQESSYRDAKQFIQVQNQENSDISMGNGNSLKGIQVLSDHRPPHPKDLFRRKLKKVTNIDSSVVSNENNKMNITNTQSDYSLSCVSSAVVSKLHSSRNTTTYDRYSLDDKAEVDENLPYIQPHCKNIMTYKRDSTLQHSPFQTFEDSSINHSSTPLLYDDSCFDKEESDAKFQLEEYRSAPHQNKEKFNKFNKDLLGMSAGERHHSNSDDEEIYQQLYQPRIMYNRTEVNTGVVDSSNTSPDETSDCTKYSFNVVDNLNTGDSTQYDSSLLHEKVADLVDYGSCKKPTVLKNQEKHMHPNSFQFRLKDISFTQNAHHHSNGDIRTSSVTTSENSLKLPLNNNTRCHGQPTSWNSPNAPEGRHVEHSDDLNPTKNINHLNETKLRSDEDETSDIDKGNADTRWKMFMESQESDEGDIDLLDIADKVKESNKVKGFNVLDSSPGLYDTQSTKMFSINKANTFEDRPIEISADNDNFDVNNSPLNVPSGKGLKCNERFGSRPIGRGAENVRFDVNNSPNSIASDRGLNRNERFDKEDNCDRPTNQNCNSDSLVSDSNDKVDENVKVCPDKISQSLFSCDSFDDMLEDECFDIEGLTDYHVKSSVGQTVVPETESAKSLDVVETMIVTASKNIGDTNDANVEVSQDSNSICALGERISSPRECDDINKLVTDEKLTTQTSEKVLELEDDVDNKMNATSPKSSEIILDSIPLSEKTDEIFVVDSANKETAEISSGRFDNDNEYEFNSMNSNGDSNNGKPDVVGKNNTVVDTLDCNLNNNKVESVKFSLDESLDLSFDFDSTKTLEVKAAPCSQKPKQKPVMRIGWKPPVKETVNLNKNDFKLSTSNIMIDNIEDNSQRLKPTFKCLRLITHMPKKENIKVPPKTANEPTCVNNDTNIFDSKMETGFSNDFSKKQIPVVSVNQRYKMPSRSSPTISNTPKQSPKVLSRDGVCQTELRFPNKSETEKLQNILRQVMIPATFTSVSNYKQIITAALIEYLNTNLLDVSRRYHHALSKVNISTYCSSQTKGNQRSNTTNSNPVCQCGVPSKMICVKKEGPNCGRYFYACSANRNQQCKWADENRKGGNSSGSKRKITDIGGLNQYMKDQYVPFYGECQIINRNKETINKYFKAPKWARYRGDADVPTKKQTLLKLSYKGRSSMYAKDDVWVISDQLDFNPTHTFIAKSTYYGPSSSLEVEIEPIYGYCPSNWQNGALCHAILAMNASTELSCIENIREHIQTQSPPVLPQLLNRNGETSIQSSSRGFQVPRSVSTSQNSNHVYLHCEQLDGIVYEYINKYNLNTDQSEAIRRVANMFSIEKSTNMDNVLLIHGVFGAGKSFLLSVMVLFLVQIFEMNDSVSPGQPFPWKLLISSTTNVAVDRILNGLLDLGFEDFVRVGSVKKISKPVLPYSVHASGTDNQELKDLQDMLRSGELTVAEKSNVRQSIEKHRRGENKKKLGKVRVVGATCAACSLNCLNQMEFPLVLLDECSQMTEPASLLPVAKFGCQKLLLVGDPKQLDPTIQSCESAHENGLEQTLFDRLIKMGCIPTLLRRQYRCHPYISDISNNLFYGGMLEDGVTIDDRKPLLDILPTVCCYDVDNGQECCESFGSYYNEQEAQFVVFLLKALLSSGIEPHNVGVITLYKSQMSRISDLISGQGESIDMKGIQVSTVDAFQGGERDIIILSTVRTNHCGFIDNDKRTNVALTRAKYHLMIVGNVNNLTRNLLWSKVLSHCKSHANGIQSAEKTRKELQIYLDQINESRVSQESYNSNSGSVASTVDSGKIVPKKRGRKRKLKSNINDSVTDKENHDIESNDTVKPSNNNNMGENDDCIQDNVGDGLEYEDIDVQTSELMPLKSDNSRDDKSKKIADRLKLLSDDLEEEDLPVLS